MKKLLLILFASVAIIACDTIADNPNVEAEEEDKEISHLKEEVLAIHDSAMARMPKMGRQMSNLQYLWKNAQDSLPYRRAFNKLKHASDDMMDWMRTFELPENVSEEEMREYLLEEKKAIQAVHSNMKKSSEEAEFLIENTPVEIDDDHSGHDHSEDDGHQH